MTKQFLWFLAVVAMVVFFYRVRIVLTPFLFAIIIAYILYPLVVLVENRGASRQAAIIIVYAVFGLFFSVLVSLVLPRLVGELDELMLRLPKQMQEWEEMGQGAAGFFKKIPLPTVMRDALSIIMERLELALEGLAAKFTGLIMGVFANLISLIIAPILAFYLLRDHEALRERSLRYVPAQYRGDIRFLASEISLVLNGFFRGQLLVCLFVGVVVYGGLLLLDIPYALFIGLVAGIFDIIPYLGPVLGFVPAAAFAFLQSPRTVLWVLLLFVGANQLENGIISPKVIGDQVGLHPLVVIFAVFVGGDLMGIMGMLLAVPLAGAVKVLLDYFLLKRTA